MSRYFVNIIRFLLLILGVTAVLTFTVHAAPTSQEATRPRFNLEEIPRQPNSQAEPSPESALAVTAPEALLPWSKVAFQSLRNGNWDIYVGNDDGTGQTAVATTGSAEIHPHLNRGNTKVVYAVNNGGDYEIYTMNVDGTGKTALTNNNTSDGNPSWSPNGGKIVFEAYRNGEADIYVMNADGSNQVRLTTDPGFDGMPTWSPDGSKIAFVSRRTGGYRIYVMNADGSGQTQISNQPYSLRPQWSPDGSQIAYDADSDGDGWQDLWRMNADGTSQTIIYNPSGQTDAWASSWSPDGSRVVYTLISFVYYQGNWYWTTAYPDARGPNVGTTRLSSSSVDWDASWQTSDIMPPVASIDSLPAFQPGTPQITWTGVDSGNSGLATFDVQYRLENTTTWTPWQTGTTLTQANFIGQPGNTYVFRVRARDSAFNYSHWQLAPGHMTLFTWGIAGKITDNVGNPVQRATISTTPSAFFGESSLADGQYATYIAPTAANYEVQWSKAGYGALPSATYPASPPENNIDILLPPVDNVLQDSGFESNGPDLASVWKLDGTFTNPSLTIDNHTGSYGARMGYNQISGPSYTSNETILYDASGEDSPYIDSPAIMFSPMQLAHVVWRNNDTGDIYHIEQLNENSWSTPTRISANTDDDTASEQLQIDQNGGVHVVWREGGEILYTWRPNGGDWTNPTALTEMAPGDMLLASKLIYHENKVSLVFIKRIPETLLNHLYYISRDLNSSWLSYETIATGLVRANLSADSDESGRLHVTVGPGPYWSEAYYWQKSLAGSWTQAKSIPIGTGTNLGTMIVAKNGEVHFLSWGHNLAIYHTKRSVTGNWSSIYTVTDQNTQHYHTKAILTESGVLQVVWSVTPHGQNGIGWGLYHSFRSSNGQWSPITKVTSSTGQYESAILFLNGAYNHSYLFLWAGNQIYFCVISPEGKWYEPSWSYSDEYSLKSAVVADDGTIHSLVSRPYGPSNGLFYSDFSFRDEYSSLSQVVTVTNTIQSPYLSFMYKMSGGNVASQSGLQLIVDDGSNQTTAAEFYEDKSNWELASVDFSPWLGQTITATWRVEQVAGTLPVYLTLDDISVGSSYTDLWIDYSGPAAALPNEQVQYTMTYGNQSPIAVADVEVSITLPETLQFVSAIPSPNTAFPTLIWDAGNLEGESGPFTITLTLQVDSEAPKFESIEFESSIDTIDSELEKINNQTIASLFIGKLTYMPVLYRD